MPRPSLLAAAAALLSGAVLTAQGPVPLSDEPHHKRLLYTAHLRLFDVTVPAGATTLNHSHDRDILTVALGPTTFRTSQATGGWADPRSYMAGTVNINNYTGAPTAHRMENVGKTPYRVLALENLRERGWSMPRVVEAPGTTLTQQSRSFAVYDVRLNSSTTRTNHVHQQPVVVILIAGSVEVQGGGGESEFRMETPGRWFPSQWDQPHTLSLAAGTEARVVEVEAR